MAKKNLTLKQRLVGAGVGVAFTVMNALPVYAGEVGIKFKIPFGYSGSKDKAPITASLTTGSGDRFEDKMEWDYQGNSKQAGYTAEVPLWNSGDKTIGMYNNFTKDGKITPIEVLQGAAIVGGVVGLGYVFKKNVLDKDDNNNTPAPEEDGSL